VERGLQRFVRLLRINGVPVSVTEALDAMRAAATPATLADRGSLRDALRVTLVKDRRDQATFDDLFDRYFRLEPVAISTGHGQHSHAHDDLTDEDEVESYTISQDLSPTPAQGHSHGKPADIREFFRPEDLAVRFNLHQEANKIDFASLTDEIVLSTDQRRGASGARVQLETSRLYNAGVPGRLTRDTGTRLDVDLTVAEERALLDWLADADIDLGEAESAVGSLANLPELLKRHLRALSAMQQRPVESPEPAGLRTERIGEAERRRLEDILRRLARAMPGALTHRREVGGRGRVDPARTMRANMRYDGVPFRPVTMFRREDKPRLVILADVSLSVRRTARFTLHLVHGLQRLFTQVRTFVFVADVAEVTDLFEQHPVERALDLVLAGDVLDVDTNSQYGAALGRFREEFGSAVTRRTTVVMLGDGRSNGADPNLEAFEEIAGRCRRLIWLTPEPRHVWRLGSCDLPSYATLCDRVEVVRDLDGLDRAADQMVNGVGLANRSRW
jgi:uncharacterized protein with von Willebrand factor type A (vWA) domain